MIDLKSVQVVASNSACLSFPVSAQLTHFGITPGDMQIRTGNTDSWPEVAEPRNGRDGQAGTLWGFKQVNGVWYAAGIERLRKYQLNGSKPVAEPRYGGLGTLFGDGWQAYGQEIRQAAEAMGVTVREVDADCQRPSAVSVGLAARLRLATGQVGEEALVPRYVQRTEAEVKFDELQGVSALERRRERVAKKLAQRKTGGRTGRDSRAKS